MSSFFKNGFYCISAVIGEGIRRAGVVTWTILPASIRRWQRRVWHISENEEPSKPMLAWLALEATMMFLIMLGVLAFFVIRTHPVFESPVVWRQVPSNFAVGVPEDVGVSVHAHGKVNLSFHWPDTVSVLNAPSDYDRAKNEITVSGPIDLNMTVQYLGDVHNPSLAVVEAKSEYTGQSLGADVLRIVADDGPVVPSLTFDTQNNGITALKNVGSFPLQDVKSVWTLSEVGSFTQTADTLLSGASAQAASAWLTGNVAMKALQGEVSGVAYDPWVKVTAVIGDKTVLLYDGIGNVNRPAQTSAMVEYAFPDTISPGQELRGEIRIGNSTQDAWGATQVRVTGDSGWQFKKPSAGDLVYVDTGKMLKIEQLAAGASINIPIVRQVAEHLSIADTLIRQPHLQVSVTYVANGVEKGFVSKKTFSWNARALLDTTLVYRTSDGNQLGRGPWPPNRSEDTTVWVSGALYNRYRAIGPWSVTFALADGVHFGDSIPAYGAGSIVAVKESQVTWTGDVMPAAAGYLDAAPTVSFPVVITGAADYTKPLVTVSDGANVVIRNANLMVPQK